MESSRLHINAPIHTSYVEMVELALMKSGFIKMYLDDYQWRYRQPAASFHELFAEAAPDRPSSRKTLRRRSLLVLTGTLLLGLAVCAMEQAARAHQCPLQLNLSRSEGSRHCFDVPPLPMHIQTVACAPSSVHGN